MLVVDLSDVAIGGVRGTIFVTDSTIALTPTVPEGESGGGEGTPASSTVKGWSFVSEPELGARWLSGDCSSCYLAQHKAGDLGWCCLPGSLCDGRDPRHGRKRWHSWGFWWTECSSEGINLGVLGKKGNVVIPEGLSSVIFSFL